ncbi:PREDICTED: chondrolectin isoform X1 [Nanorana parkeri]|uniref:chondrolectin isoform X1 n=1 Tax=Nanorana parkeri TaxID=125878 RepID=UPI0008543D10|nr:PREDICTED: chondrolectin isoform X1 [Nanorana parkeri]
MYPFLYSNAFLVLLGANLWGHGSSDTRVVSGRKICYAGYKHPCYKIAYFQDLTARVGYHHAHQVCSGEGGHLLSIESEAEQKLIERMLQNLTNSGSGKSDGDFWIGLSRNLQSMATSGACPDLYMWADGSTALFRNWYADEPSCGSEGCVVMYHQPTANPGIGGPYMYQWNDDRCNMKHNFICKYPPENILEKEKGDRAEPDYDPQSPVTTERTYATNRPDDSSHVTAVETGLMPNLIYVIIPTIPLLLLILVAFGTCCFQMLHKSKERTKTSPTQSTLWISKAPRNEINMEV